MKSVILLAIPFAILACNPTTNIKEPVEDREANRGRISIPLTSTSSSGTTYVLHLPSVLIEGAEENLELNFEENEEFDISLQEGDYTVTLQEWTLYRAEDDEMVPVDAEITSDNPQIVSIYAGETTNTVIQFRTNSDDTYFGEGDLEIGFEVEEGDPESSPDYDSGQSTPVECGTESFNGDITFSDQKELDLFIAQYDTVIGSLTLEGQGIENASGLSCLESFSLIIQDTSIENLDVVAQESLHILKIENNPVLQTVFVPTQGIGHFTVTGNQELFALETEHNNGANFNVQDNPSLEVISLPFLQENSLDFYVQYNSALHSFQATGLRVVGERLRVEGNATLVELNLSSLEMTGGSVIIQENEVLRRISMPELVVVGELSHTASSRASLSILDNDGLTTTDFPSLFYVSRHLNISNNALLETLDGFDTLVSVDDLTITGNGRLHSVIDLATVTEVGKVNISFNPHLSESMVNYLYEVEIGATSVEGDVHISNNSQVFLEDYGTSSCSAEYTAVQSGDFYPIGSVVFMSSAELQCSSNEAFLDGTVWEISGECRCN